MPSVYIKKPKTKIIKCVSCDNTLEVGIKARKPWRCIHCGIKAMIDFQHQMHDHSGPLYEKWLVRMAEWAVVQSRTSGGSPRENSPSSDGAQSE